MKRSRIAKIVTLALALALGFIALAGTAQDRPANDKDHPKQDNKQQQARPEQQHAQQHTQQSRPSSERGPAVQPQQRENHASHRTAPSRLAAQRQNRPVTRQQNHARDSHGASRPQQNHGRRVQQAAWQQHSAANWQSDHRTWQQRGGYHGYRIPNARFRGHFGPGHGFLIRGLPFMVVGGFPRFQYNGYWVSVADPWPQQWGNDWYDNDQVYVDYADGGYYLYNRSYPGIGIAVSISM